MSHNLATIDVNAPIEVVYDQWSMVEMFPACMEEVDSVTATAEDRQHWVTKIGRIERAFDSEVVERIPDEPIAGPASKTSVTRAR